MAGRIPDSFIQDLLARIDIVEIIGARLQLARAGKEFKARSPFSNEKTPSFFVSPSKQMFFDFSSGKNGTAITFLMEHDRLSFIEAVEELAQHAGIEVPREGGHTEQLVLEGPLDALAASQRYFRDQLRTSNTAVEYLKGRGVSGETAKTFGIGFAPDQWTGLAEFLKETQHAMAAGLIKKKDETGRVYDIFRNRIMFPIRDTRGRVIAFGGRTLGNDPAKYLNSPETPLFHKGRNLYGLFEARQSSKSALPYLIVVEGYMDVVMLAQYGVREVVGTLGTATTPDHLNLIFKATSKVVFCFDGDRAGRSAASRALDQVLPEIHGQRECCFMFIPDGQDPDTWIQQIGAVAFRKHVEGAMPLSEFLLAELTKQVSLNSMDGRAKLATLARPYLLKMREGPLRDLLTDELARITRLSKADLLKFNQSGVSPLTASPDSVPSAAPATTRIVKRALQLLLERPELAERVQNLDLLAQARVQGLAVLIDAIDFFMSHPQATAAQLSEFWRPMPKRAAAIDRLLHEETSLLPEAIETEFMDAIARLLALGTRNRVQELLDESQTRTLTEGEKQEINALTRRSPISAG